MVSFLGSIPPGTLNLSVLQLGLEHKVNTALRFALAVAIVEYPYAWIAVAFDYWVTESPLIVNNFKIISASVMLVMGILNIYTANRPSHFAGKFQDSGFRRGIILSLLNPMAIPFWMAFTAYFSMEGWIHLDSAVMVHCFVAGTSVGAMILLTCFAFLARRLSKYVQNSKWVKLAPGLVMLLLGVYTFIRMWLP